MAEKGQEIAVVEQPTFIKAAGTIAEMKAAFREYQQLKTELADDNDFTTIGQKRHPNKSYVRKMQRFFNLSCELIRDEPIRQGDDIVAWAVTARAIHLPTGAYQEADGSCSLDEKRGNQQTIHNIRSHAVTRAKNRAILDLVGFGDVSAEEILEEKQGRSGSQKRRTASDAKSQADPVARIPEEYFDEDGVFIIPEGKGDEFGGLRIDDPEIPVSYLVKKADSLPPSYRAIYEAEFHRRRTAAKGR